MDGQVCLVDFYPQPHISAVPKVEKTLFHTHDLVGLVACAYLSWIVESHLSMILVLASMAWRHLGYCLVGTRSMQIRSNVLALWFSMYTYCIGLVSKVGSRLEIDIFSTPHRFCVATL